jgi:hypothetical protein
MFKIHKFTFVHDEDQEGADRQTASLAGLAFALLLVVVGLFLVHTLQHKTMIEDCLLSGRTNCAPISVTGSDATLRPFR